MARNPLYFKILNLADVAGCRNTLLGYRLEVLFEAIAKYLHANRSRYAHGHAFVFSQGQYVAGVFHDGDGFLLDRLYFLGQFFVVLQGL